MADKRDNGHDKFYFFRVDRDKIRLQLKSLGSKLIRKSHRRQGLLIFLILLLLVGGGIVINNNYPGFFGQETLPESSSPLPRPGNEEIDEEQEQITIIEEEEAEGIQETATRSDSDKSDKGISETEEGVVTVPAFPMKDLEAGDRANIKSEDTSVNIKSTDTSGAEEGASESAAGQVVEESPDLTSREWLIPVAGEIASKAGWFYHPVFGDWRYQPGIEIQASANDVVMAADSGRVVAVFEDKYKGVMVRVDHGNDWYSSYGHLQRVVVNEGDVIGKGQELGRVGASGMVFSPSLYFELVNGEGSVDPEEFLSW
ncbi:MAG: M23 family metallopeptidase [Bacillota bacterium]